MRRWLSGLLAFGALLGASDALGYCRKTTCKTCPLDPATGCTEGGQPLVWPAACVSYSLSRLASTQVSLAAAADTARKAMDVWQSVSCPGTGESPSISVADEFGGTSCSLAEYSRTGANANVVLFRDDEWPYPDSEDALGLTTVSFDSVTGQILDADIEVNATVPLSLGDVVPSENYDLLSILTHEAGHFLGLAHSQDMDAVMRPSFDSGTTSLRVPSDDDIAGICAIYPPERRALPCDYTPRGGFASECPLGIFKGGCAVASPAPVARRSSDGAIGLLFLGVMAFVRRKTNKAAARRRGSAETIQGYPGRQAV